MKKIILCFVLFSICLMPIAAQAHGISESELYYVNVTIERIYPYTLGYIVLYRGSGYSLYQTYIPREWFVGTDGKAEIVNLRQGREWPSMTVYYLRGEFSHVRLRLRERAHPTWGLLQPGVNMDAHFEDFTEIRLNF